jgi:hypothetical protein
MDIKLYEAEYQPFVGQPYLLLTMREISKNTIIEIFGILQREDETHIIKVKVYKYQDSEKMLEIFPDINAIIEKDVLPNAEFFMLYKFIIPAATNDNYGKKPVFKDIGKEQFGLRFYRNSDLLTKIYKKTSNDELKKYIDGLRTMAETIVIEQMEENDLT